MQVSRGNNVARLCINFVDIILSSSDEDILDAIIERVNEWLGVDLLQSIHIVTGQLGLPKFTKLRASDDGWVHVVSPDDDISMEYVRRAVAGGCSGSNSRGIA